MATTYYFEENIVNDINDARVHVEIGTTTCKTLQVYLNVGRESIVFNHKDAKAFCEAVAEIYRYMSFEKET